MVTLWCSYGDATTKMESENGRFNFIIVNDRKKTKAANTLCVDSFQYVIGYAFRLATAYSLDARKNFALHVLEHSTATC